MVKLIFVVSCLTLALCGSSTSTNIECKFTTQTDSILGRTYQCSINNNPNIIAEESAQISRVIGWHVGSRSNNYLDSIDARSKTIQIFPKGLEKFFKNIQKIFIYHCELKAIHQADLKVFPDLVYFFVWGNDIEVIEEGLFDFNPKLEAIGFDESKVIHIDPNVFDNLSKLSNFWFLDVPCVAKLIDKSFEKVQHAIQVVKSQCTNSDFLSLDTQIKILESESKALDSASFNTKLTEFEKNFNASKFSKYRPLNYKFQNLKTGA